jgi:hypothetical protein
LATVAQRLQSERLKYPGLLPDEIIVLRNWLALHEHGYDRFDYNVRLGPDLDPGPQYSDGVRKSVILSGKLRVDAVAYKGDQAYLIEVKRRAVPSNIGQLLTYYHAWVMEHPAGPAPKMILVCNGCTPNIIPAVLGTGIDLQRVDAVFDELRTRRPLPTA